jgi:acetylornithine/N-succinyldiaminopimelate aminotransferase
MQEIAKFEPVKEVRGKGLMIGIEFDIEIAEIRKKLLFDKKIFTGVSGKHIIRLLPPLNLKIENAQFFIKKFEEVLNEMALI